MNARSHRPRLLNRDLSDDLHVPDESSLTEDQWRIADILRNLEEAFFEEKLSVPRRKALARMQVIWREAELGEQDLRVLRAVEAVGKAIMELREQRTSKARKATQKKKTLKYGDSRSVIARRRARRAREAALSVEEKAAADAEVLIEVVDGAFNGEVFGEELDLQKQLFEGPSKVDILKKLGGTMELYGAARRNGGLAASGVLAVLLKLAGVASRKLVKRIDSACTRARKLR
jgi:hypothetical protein